MSTLDEIRAATAALTAEEQVELFRWWTQSGAFKARQLAALKRDIAIGIEQLEHGDYSVYDDNNIRHLADAIGRGGRARLRKSRKNT